MRAPVSALGSEIGSRITDGCQSAQIGTCQPDSVAVGDRTCVSAEYFDHSGSSNMTLRPGRRQKSSCPARALWRSVVRTGRPICAMS